MMEESKVIVLGAQASYSSDTEGTSAQALIVGKDVYLLDCGFGCLSALLRHKISPESIKGIFITHSHLDHVGGLPELLWYFENRGRKDPLKICSLEEIPRLPEIGFKLIYEDIDIPGVTVTVIPLKHRVPCRGYSFEGKGLSYAYITDTEPFPELSGMLMGIKTLYLEATYTDNRKESARLWVHTTGKEAGEIAKEAGVRKLILGHISHSVNPEKVLEEAREVFKGEVVR